MSVLRVLTEFLPFFLAVLWGGLALALSIQPKGERSIGETVLHSLPLGISAWVVLLQFCWALGWNARLATWPCLGLFTVANAVCAARAWRQPIRGFDITRNAPVWPALAGLGGALLLPCAVLAASAGGYYGRAWGDQLNYTLLTNYLLEISPRGPAPGFLRPALQVVIDGGLLTDRIGQCFLQALAELSGGSDLFQAFYYVCVLGIAAGFAALFLLARCAGAGPVASAAAGLCGALAPCTHMIGLESFLSQALVTPVVIYALVLADSVLEKCSATRIAALAVCTAFTLSAYHEFFPVLLGALLAVGVADLWRARRLRPALAGLALSCALGALHAATATTNPFALMARTGQRLPGFEKFFPWTYSWEGFARLVVGDWVTSLSPGQVKLIGLLVLLGTVAAAGALAWAAWKRRRAAAAGALALLALPLAIAILPGERSYQFYKILQSFWPLVFVGGAVAMRSKGSVAIPRLTRLWAGSVTAALVLVMGAASGAMLFAERGTGAGSPRSGMNRYLSTYPAAAFARLLSGRPERRLVLSSPTRRHWNDLLANGITALQCDRFFDAIEATWIKVGDRTLKVPANPAVPADPASPDVRTLQPAAVADPLSCLLLQIGLPWLQPAPELMTLVRAEGRLLLLKPAPGQGWCFPTTAQSRAPVGFLDTDRCLSVASRPDNYLRIDFESSQPRPEGLVLTLEFVSTEGTPRPDWHLYSDMGYGTQKAGEEGRVSLLTGPLRQGVTEIFLGPVDPRIGNPLLSKGETRAQVTHLVYGPKP